METELLLRHIEDLCARADRAGIVTHTAFLTPEEQVLVSDRARRLRAGCTLFGGFAGAERRMAFFGADEGQDLADVFQTSILCVRIDGDVGELTHRDYLGALMHLGLERDAVGDILPGKSGHILCVPAAARLIRNELFKIGNKNVTVSETALTDIPVPEVRTEELRFTVKSPRLDAVCAGMFHLSRTEAAERIKRGDCAVNHRPTDKPDYTLNEGDTVTLRGFGRAEIASFGGKTKKDRIFLMAQRRV